MHAPSKAGLGTHGGVILVARDASAIAVVVLLGRGGFGANPSHVPQVWFGAGIGTCTYPVTLDLGALDFV